MLSSSGNASSQRGFSIVELMMVIVILGIIVAIAYPSYRAFKLRVHRTEATLALLDVADRMQQYYVDNKTYTNDFVALGLGGEPFITENANYSVRVRDNGGGGGACPIAVCFELEAAPIGMQADDTDCALFKLNSAGVKAAVADNNSQNDSCW